MKRKLLSLTLLCMMASAYAAPAQVYKWTDANGVVHYSDAPPPLSTPKVETLHVDGADRAHAMPAEAAKAGDASKKATASNAPAANVPPSDPENRALLCEKARQNLELLQSKYPVGLDTAGDGKPQVLDDESRQAETRRSQERVAQLCQ